MSTETVCAVSFFVVEMGDVPELLSVLLQVFAIRKVLLDGASNLMQA
jgi:hypothetical protein